jgi:hypothetical protein
LVKLGGEKEPRWPDRPRDCWATQFEASSSTIWLKIYGYAKMSEKGKIKYVSGIAKEEP